MSVVKWIGGILGFMTAGPLGALAGVVIASFFEQSLNSFADGGSDGNSNGSYRNTYESSYYDRYGRQSRVNMGQRNSFLFSILVLASYIIRADGKVMHSEMEYVRQFLRSNFGPEAVTEGNQILNRLFEEQKRRDAQQPGSYHNVVMECCQQMARNMSYSQRLQMLSFLAQICKCDGAVVAPEINALRSVARALQLSDAEVDSMLNLQDAGTNVEAAYKVLEISPNATDDEVRKAYRKLALKHHPDKVATLGEDVKKAAEKKFQEINAAKDLIYKVRGMK